MVDVAAFDAQHQTTWEVGTRHRCSRDLSINAGGPPREAERGQ